MVQHCSFHMGLVNHVSRILNFMNEAFLLVCLKDGMKIPSIGIPEIKTLISRLLL